MDRVAFQRPATPRITALTRWAPVLFVTVLLGACGTGESEAEESGIPRETFISAYVGLRTVALADSAGELPVARKDSVLRAHGVTEEELLGFVDIRGGDAAYMKTVWDSVESRLQRARETRMDSTAPPEAPRDTAGGR